MVELLDAATLGLLDVFRLPSSWRGDRPLLSFSPDSRSLTLYIYGRIVTWDLQTGGKTADFRVEPQDSFSSTYSIDGRFFAVLSKDPFASGHPPRITAYDLLLGTRTYQVRASTKRIALPIWTHGECIRFAAVENRSIAIYEVGFTPAHVPVEVESFPAPDRIAHAHTHLFLPTLSRLAFGLFDVVEIWDTQQLRTLLQCTGGGASMMSFSTDGQLFACVANQDQEVHVWRESATGYELCQRLPLTPPTVEKLVLSPSGRSIIMASRSIHLLFTAGPTLPLPSISTQRTTFTLAFSPDESLAAIARNPGNTITVVNLESGDRRLVIETDMRTRALGVTGSTLAAVGDGKAVTLTIPTGDGIFKWANINDSARTAILDQSGSSSDGDRFHSASISPGLDRIAVVGGSWNDGYLSIYDTSTGKYLGGVERWGVATPRFTPDGREVWVVDPPFMEKWKIVENEGSDLIELEPLESTACPPGVLPWQSSRGHHVHDGWVLNSSRERILWLPHHWRSGEWEREWGGRFLGLLHKELPEAVILELCD